MFETFLNRKNLTSRKKVACLEEESTVSSNTQIWRKL